MDIIKSVDHIIDLGPFGGERGGYIVAEGTPEEVVKVKKSQTGHYLRRALAMRTNGRRDGRLPRATASNSKRAGSGAKRAAKAKR